jgi:hypothetical protein
VKIKYSEVSKTVLRKAMLRLVQDAQISLIGGRKIKFVTNPVELLTPEFGAELAGQLVSSLRLRAKLILNDPIRVTYYLLHNSGEVGHVRNYMARQKNRKIAA